MRQVAGRSAAGWGRWADTPGTEAEVLRGTRPAGRALKVWRENLISDAHVIAKCSEDQLDFAIFVIEKAIVKILKRTNHIAELWMSRFMTKKLLCFVDHLAHFREQRAMLSSQHLRLRAEPGGLVDGVLTVAIGFFQREMRGQLVPQPV